MELPIAELFLLVGGVFGMGAALIYSRARFGNNEINTKIKNRLYSHIQDIEKENKQLKGQVNRAKQPVRISEEAAEDPLSAISEVVEGLVPHLPPTIRPLLKSKKAVDFITNYVQQNPDAVKDIISKFTKQPTAKANNQQTAAMESTL